MNKLWLIAFWIVGTLLGMGIINLTSSQPQGIPITLRPPPTPAPIVVHITGAVDNPGVYQLPADSRVNDGIEAAGGALQEANLQALNLAAILEDGDRLLVPFTPVDTPTPVPIPTFANRFEVPLDISLVNINTASQEELETLPEIGPKTAAQIITYREANGFFSRIEDIENVPGIGPKTFEKIKNLISVGKQY